MPIHHHNHHEDEDGYPHLHLIWAIISVLRLRLNTNHGSDAEKRTVIFVVIEFQIPIWASCCLSAFKKGPSFQSLSLACFLGQSIFSPNYFSWFSDSWISWLNILHRPAWTLTEKSRPYIYPGSIDPKPVWLAKPGKCSICSTVNPFHMYLSKHSILQLMSDIRRDNKCQQNVVCKTWMTFVNV